MDIGHTIWAKLGLGPWGWPKSIGTDENVNVFGGALVYKKQLRINFHLNFYFFSNGVALLNDLVDVQSLVTWEEAFHISKCYFNIHNMIHKHSYYP